MTIKNVTQLPTQHTQAMVRLYRRLSNIQAVTRVAIETHSQTDGATHKVNLHIDGEPAYIFINIEQVTEDHLQQMHRSVISQRAT